MIIMFSNWHEYHLKRIFLSGVSYSVGRSLAGTGIFVYGALILMHILYLNILSSNALLI